MPAGRKRAVFCERSSFFGQNTHQNSASLSIELVHKLWDEIFKALRPLYKMRPWQNLERKFPLQPFPTCCIVILVKQEKSVLTGMRNCYGEVSGDCGITCKGEDN